MKNLETKLSSVSVYRRGCQMTSEGRIEMEAGSVRCRIEGLTAGTDSESVRLRTSEGLKAYEVQVVYPDEDEQKEITREVDEKITLCDAAIDACQVQEELWKSNLSFKSREGLDLAKMEEYEGMLAEKLTRAAERKLALEKEKEGLLKERRELEKKLGRPYVTAVLSCEKDGTYYVQLQTFDHAASWHPAYEIRTDGETGPLSLRLRAAVRQNTDADWEQTELKLYTGTPSQAAGIPVLNPTHLRFYQPVMYAKRASAPGNMMMAMGSAMMDAAMEETAEMDFAESERTEAEVNAQETMTEYALKGKWNVASDGKEVMADLSEKQIECEYHVVTVPKKDTSAYLAAAVRTADLEDVLHSRAAVYLKDTYAGEVVINADLTKDTYELSLGRDETVSVRRNQTRKYTSSVLLKNQYKTEYAYETAVVSNKQKPCKVTVIDQIPVSEEKTIIVEKTELSGGKLNEETGEVVFEAELAPGESRTFTLAWNVLRPKDKEIVEAEAPAASGFCPVCGARVFGRFCPECGAEVS